MIHPPAVVEKYVPDAEVVFWLLLTSPLWLNQGLCTTLGYVAFTECESLRGDRRHQPHPSTTLRSRTSIELLHVIAEGEPEEFVGNVESFLGEYAKDLLPMPDDMTNELRRLDWRVRRPPAQLARLSAALAPAARWATTQTTATTAGRERPRTLPGPTLGVWGPSLAERTRPPIPESPRR